MNLKHKPERAAGEGTKRFNIWGALMFFDLEDEETIGNGYRDTGGFYYIAETEEWVNGW